MDKDSYNRLRGTNTHQLEPVQDPKGENSGMIFGSTLTQSSSSQINNWVNGKWTRGIKNSSSFHYLMSRHP